MKERPLSNSEKVFILNAALENKRLDGRSLTCYREFELHFGADYGSCFVSLGETKVLSQVMFEIEEPKQNKPGEGLMFINVDIGGLAASHFETGRQNNLAIRVSRLLEKGIKESNCVDLEGLCIVAADKVWVLRIEIIVLNHDGNVYSCCSIAALASLLNTRLPQVTLEDDNVIVHSTKEKSPLPLSVHHFPLAISFALIHDGTVALADPTDLEERIQESELIYYMNSYRELCGLHFGGKPVKNKNILLLCANTAASLTEQFVKRIRNLLEEESKRRDKLLSQVPGFVDCINLDRILAASQDRTSIKVTLKDVKREDEISEEDMEETENVEIDATGTGLLPSTGISSFGSEWVPAGGISAWAEQSSSEEEELEEEESSDEESEESEVEIVKTITEKDRIIDNIELIGDSEEEETTVLEGKDIC